MRSIARYMLGIILFIATGIFPSTTLGTPASFILVHGATGGGWDWKKVAEALQENGHQVFRPTLTGLGARMHLARPDINLTTHISDIENLIRFESLQNVVLVGHSYGGMVISGVLHKMPERLAAVVYLDAMLPANGMSALELTELGEAQLPVKNGLIYFPWLQGTNGFPSDVPHPLRSYNEPVSMTNPAAAEIHGVYIGFRDPVTQKLLPFVTTSKNRAQNNKWLICELVSDHNPQRHMPDRLARLIEQSALRETCPPDMAGR